MYIELFGFVSVAAMLLFYALEARGSGFVLAFAAACLCAAVYAAVIGAWPFAAVEAIWCIVALLRWRRRRAASGRRPT